MAAAAGTGGRLCRGEGNLPGHRPCGTGLAWFCRLLIEIRQLIACPDNAALISVPWLNRSYLVSFSTGLILKEEGWGEHEGVNYTSAEWHNLYLCRDLLTVRTWQSGIEVFNSLKRFLFSTGYSHSLKPPFLQSPTLPSSRGDFHQRLQGEPTDQCKLHGGASSSLFQDLANWKIILTCYSKIWNKRRQITASSKWDPSWEMRSSEVFGFFLPLKRSILGKIGIFQKKALETEFEIVYMNRTLSILGSYTEKIKFEEHKPAWN